MASLADLRAAIVATLSGKLPTVPVAPHGGVFDLDEIRRYAVTAPAILIAIVGAGRAARWKDGRWAVPVRCAAVIVTRDAAPGDVRVGRDAAALALAAAVELAIVSNRFGLEGVLQPDDVEAHNEYSGPIDKFGVALWQVTWTSTVLLGEPFGDSIDPVIAALTEGIVNGTPEWTASDGLAGVDVALAEPFVAAPAGSLR